MPENVKVIDGGFSTQLAYYVGDIIDGDPLWSARFLHSNPEAVVKTHLDFLEAGAKVIITNSYQGSIQGFMEHLGLNEAASYQLLKNSVKLADQAREAYLKTHPTDTEKPLIAGSVGPFGASLHDGSEYNGNYIDKVSKETIVDWHRPRIKALIEEGVDLLAIETIPTFIEAKYILELLEEEYPEQKAWLSFQCKDSKYTARGENFQETVKKCWSLNKKQLVAVGCNCVNPKYVSELFSGINENTEDKIPLVVYANSGEEYSPDKGCSQDSRWSGCKKPIDINDLVNEWIDLGARYIGGCCRIDASHIKSIAKAVQERMSRKQEADTVTD